MDKNFFIIFLNNTKDLIEEKLKTEAVKPLVRDMEKDLLSLHTQSCYRGCLNFINALLFKIESGDFDTENIERAYDALIEGIKSE